MQRTHRFRAMAISASIGLIAAVALVIPASAQSIPAIRPTTTCSSPNPCIEYDNNGIGSGVRGKSKNGNGVGGFTMHNSTAATNAQFGVFGNDISTSGIFNSGVRGVSVRGQGVSGVSTSGDGVFGEGGAVGVEGLGDTGSTSIGVLAANLGSGLEFDAIDSHGNSLFSVDASGNTTSVGHIVAGTSSSFAGVVGTGGPYGLIGYDHGTATLVLQDLSTGGDLIDGYDHASSLKFTVDDLGNVAAHSFMSILLMTRQPTSTGRELTTYASQSSTPAVEDFGEGQLVDGRAFVALEQTFATTIDRTAGYMVFITPEGDTRGVYVTQKTAAGFVVRENQGGRSTVPFSYRVVAKPFGSHAARLPLAAKQIRIIPPPLPHPPRMSGPRPDLVRLQQTGARR
jgi:hypothetical protein